MAVLSFTPFESVETLTLQTEDVNFFYATLCIQVCDESGLIYRWKAGLMSPEEMFLLGGSSHGS
jgi:hypothetical protein